MLRQPVTTRLRVLARLIAALPPIAAIVFGGIIIRREFDRVRTDAVGALTQEISSSLGVAVSVDGVDASVPGTLAVRGLRLARDGMGEVLSARNVIVRYSVSGLARNLSSPASTVSSVTFDGPIVVVERYADGRINLLELLKGPGPPGKPFRGRVEVRDGSVRYIDHAPLSRIKQPMVIAGNGVNGYIDLSLDGRPFSARMASTSVSGAASARGAFDKAGRLTLNVAARNLSLPFVDRYFIAVNGLSLDRGTASGKFLLTRAPGRGPGMWLDATTSGAAVKLPGSLPALEAVDGRVTFAGTDYASFDGTAAMAGGRWRVSGKVADLAKPAVWADASSASVNYASLAALAPRGSLQGISPSGSGPLSIRARGPLAAMAISGRAAVPRVSYKGYQLSGVRAVFDYGNGRLVLPAISASAGQGKLAGHASLQIGKQPRGSGTLRFSGVSLAAINPELKGRLWGDANLSLDGGRPSGRVLFQGRDMEAFDRRATSAVGDVRISGSKAHIESLLVATPQGFVTASGTAGLGRGPDARLDLEVSGSGITMADILGQKSTANASGTFDAQGTITGPLVAPAFEGRVHGLKVAWESESVDVLAGNLYISRSRISTEGLTVVRGVSEATLRGDIIEPLSPARRLDLSASVRALHLEDLAGYVPALRLMEGAVTGELSRVSGTERSLRVDFDLAAENLRYRTYVIPQTAMKGSYNGGEFAVSSLTATRGPAQLTASGSLRRQGALDFDFKLSSLPLDELMPMFLGQPLPLTASLGMEGHLGGTTPEPTLTADARLQDLNIAGEQVAATSARIEWRDDVLSVGQTVVQLAGGPVSLDELRFSTASDASGLKSAVVSMGALAGAAGKAPVEGAASVDLTRALVLARTLGLMSRISSKDVRNAAFTAPERVQGALDGTVRLDGTDQGIRADMQASIGGLKLYGADIGTASLHVTTGPAGYEVKELTIEDGDMQVSAKGTLTTDRALHADVEGYNIDLNRIQNVAALKGVSGALDISFQADGTLDDPKIQGSVAVASGRVGRVDIERFTTGMITAGADSVELAETTITTGPHGLRLSGTLPFSLTRLALVDGGPVDIQAELVRPDLDILTLVSSMLDEERTGGEGEGRVSVAGQWPSPRLEGFVRFPKGDIALKGAGTTLKDIKIDVALNGPAVTINEFRLPSSDGGELSLTGGASLGRDGWELQLAALAEDMGLKFKNLSGLYGESYNGKVDVDVQAAGPLRAMKLTGAVTAHNATVGLPSSAAAPEERGRLAINPALDITLNAGRGLRVRGPRMNVGVAGQARLAQTAASPLLNGRLEVTEGYLLFPGSRFRVVPVGTIDFRYAPPEEGRVSVDIRAETNLSAAANASRPGVSSYRVEMAVRGSLENPRVSFQSYPPGLEASGILAMLGQQAGLGPSGFGGDSFEREVAQLFTANLAPGVLQPVESALAEALGLQEVAFGFGGPDEMLSTQVQRRLFDGVSLSYWKNLAGGQEDDEWKLTYDISRRLRLTYGESRFRARTIGFEGAISF